MKVVLISLLLLVFSFLGFTVIFIHFSGLVTYISIMNHGSRAMGTVIEKERWEGTEAYYHVKYEFHAPGGELLTKRWDSKRLWDELEVGDRIEIAFAPDEPAKNFPSARRLIPYMGIEFGVILLPVWAFILVSLFGVLVFLLVEGVLITWLLDNLHKRMGNRR